MINLDKVKLGNLFTYLAVITSVLSFSANNTVSSLCSKLMYVFLVLSVVEVIIKSREIIKLNRTVYYMALVYAVWAVLSFIFYHAGIYPSGSLGIVIFLKYCIPFYILGLNIKSDESGANVKKIILAFAAAQVIMMLTLIPELNTISAEFSQYNAKNQMGQMLGIGIVFEAFILPDLFSKGWQKAISWGIGAVSLVSLMIIHSRTPLIGIVVCAIISFISKKDKTGKDYFNAFAIIFILSSVIMYLGGPEYISELFSGSDQLDTGGANAFFTGRPEIWKEAFFDFLKNPITGVGAWAYIDNHILNTLRCGGVILAVLIFPIGYGKMFFTFKKSIDTINAVNPKGGQLVISQVVWKMIPFYFVISLMEGYPPLGPGSSLFFFWIVLGMFDGIYYGGASEIVAENDEAHQIKPVLSIIIPVYNTGKLLNRCIDSLLDQTFRNFEIILINDGSRDESLSICEEYCSKYTFIKLIDKKNEGAGAARNDGLSVALGDYICFIDSDDWAEPNMLERLMDGLDEDNTIAVCSFYNGRKNSKTEKLYNVLVDGSQFKSDDIPYFVANAENAGTFKYLWNKIYNKRIIDEHNIRFEKQFTVGEDLAFNLKYFKFVNNCIVIDEPLYHFTKSAFEPLRLKYTENLYDIITELCKRRYEFYNEYSMLDNEEYKKIYEKKYVDNFMRCVSNIYRRSVILTRRERKKMLEELIKTPKLAEYCKRYDKPDKKTNVFIRVICRKNASAAEKEYANIYLLSGRFNFDLAKAEVEENNTCR